MLNNGTVCGICQEHFSKPSALKRHMRTVYRDVTSEPAYQCARCSKKFARLDSLHRHEATHDRSGYSTCPGFSKLFRPDFFPEHLRAPKNTKCRAAADAMQQPRGKRTDEVSSSKDEESSLVDLRNDASDPCIEMTKDGDLHGNGSATTVISVFDTPLDDVMKSQTSPASRPRSGRSPDTAPVDPLSQSLGDSSVTPGAESAALKAMTTIECNSRHWNDEHQGPVLVPDSPVIGYQPLLAHDRLLPTNEEAEALLSQLTGTQLPVIHQEIEPLKDLSNRSMLPNQQLSSVERVIQELRKGQRLRRPTRQDPRIWECNFCGLKIFHRGQANAVKEHAALHIVDAASPIRWQSYRCEITFAHVSDYRYHWMSCDEDPGKNGQCDKLMPSDGDDWVQGAVREKYICDLRIWERCLLYKYLDEVYQYMHLISSSGVCIGGQSDDTRQGPTSRSLIGSGPAKVFSKGSLFQNASCSTYTRYNERFNPALVVEKFTSLTIDDQSSQQPEVAARSDNAAA